MIESAITSKGQTTRPKVGREALGVRPGDRARQVVPGNEVRIPPLRPIGALFGVLAYERAPVTLEDMERAVAEGACEG